MMTQVIISLNFTEAPKVDMASLFGAKEVKVRAGEPLKLALGISGSPTPTVEWSKNGKPVTRANTKSTDDEAFLEIPKTNREDSGKYTITVSNDFGTASADIPVYVLGKITTKQ